MDDVEDAGREARLQRQLTVPRRRQRRLLRHLISRKMFANLQLQQWQSCLF